VDLAVATERWSALDRARITTARDAASIEATAGLRARVLDELLRSRHGPPSTDLLHASSMLGRLLQVLGASPGFAMNTLDGAAEALGAEGPWAELRAWLAAPRAALAEGYVAALGDESARRAAAAWEPPRCIVRRGELVTVAAGFPEEDADALHAWAGRVASHLARAGVRSAIISGSPMASTALAEALELAGVRLAQGDPLA
jgi:hypothetical protein